MLQLHLAYAAALDPLPPSSNDALHSKSGILVAYSAIGVLENHSVVTVLGVRRGRRTFAMPCAQSQQWSSTSKQWNGIRSLSIEYCVTDAK